MNCPVCKLEMTKGFINVESCYWHPNDKASNMFYILKKFINFGNPTVIAYRCQNCGKIELTTEVNENKSDNKQDNFLN